MCVCVSVCLCVIKVVGHAATLKSHEFYANKSNNTLAENNRGGGSDEVDVDSDSDDDVFSLRA